MTDFEVKFFYLEMKPREPYVKAGQVVDWIGPPGTRRGFIGGRVVMFVGSLLQSEGYYVRLRRDSFSNDLIDYWDTELSFFREEVPDGFWRMPISKGFKNVHEYVRWKRREQAVKHASAVLKRYGR